MGIIEGIVALLKAIPVLDSWFQKLAVAYFNSRVAAMKQENRDAIKKAIESYDQRDAEKAIGNPHAGEISGNPGTSVVDTLPGVPRAPGN